MYHLKSGSLKSSRTQRMVALATNILLIGGSTLWAGPYSGSSNDPTNPFDPPVQSTSPLIKAWASTVVDYSPSPQSNSFTTPENATGDPQGTFGIVSLGDLTAADLDNNVDPGSITLGFDSPIYNGLGIDFAVFENGFVFSGGIFGELAYVEVSTNGVDFARFDSESQHTTPIGGFGSFDPTGVYNLAGKHASGWGTPFNLDDLTTHTLVLSGSVNLDQINYVRMVDIPGRGDYLDSLGNPIYDPWLTVGSGGLDLDALGVLNESAPQLQVSSTVLNPFDAWETTHGPSPTQVITLTNTGSGPLSFTGNKIEIDGDAAFEVFPRPSTLGPLGEGESIDLFVASNPDSGGLTSATLRILSDSVTSQTLTIALQGEGIDPVAHDWQQVSGLSHGTGRQFVDNPITRLDEPTWETSDEGLATDGSVVVLPGTPDLVIAWGGDLGGTPFDGSDDSVFVKAFNADSGALVWTSPALNAGNTLSYASWHTASADSVTGSVVMATGGEIYCLNGTDGSILWNSPLNAGGSDEIVNGSVTIGGGRAFVTTYGGFSITAKRLYAFDMSDGSLSWSIQDGGPGSEAPIYVNNGLGEVVYTLLDRGIAAYDATDGTLLWDNSLPLSGSPWSTTYGFFGGMSYADGVIVAPTYNFGGVSELLAVDGWTGELLWKNDAVLSGDSTPVILNGRAYLTGPEFWGGPSYVSSYDLTDGSEDLKISISDDSTMWNISPVAYNDAIAVTLSSDAFSPGADTGVRLIDPLTGSDLVVPTTDSFSARGTPAIGKDGRLYVYRESGALAAYIPVSFDNQLLADQNGSLGLGQTDERFIDVTLTAPFATEMRIVEKPDSIASASWVPFSENFTFQLSAGSGMKTLEVQVRNGSSESAAESISIELLESSSVGEWMILND